MMPGIEGGGADVVPAVQEYAVASEPPEEHGHENAHLLHPAQGGATTSPPTGRDVVLGGTEGMSIVSILVKDLIRYHHLLWTVCSLYSLSQRIPNQ